MCIGYGYFIDRLIEFILLISRLIKCACYKSQKIKYQLKIVLQSKVAPCKNRLK